jgi:hypothetical protein
MRSMQAVSNRGRSSALVSLVVRKVERSHDPKSPQSVPTQFRQSGPLRGGRSESNPLASGGSTDPRQNKTACDESRLRTCFSIWAGTRHLTISNTNVPTWPTSYNMVIVILHSSSVQISTRKLKRKETTIPCMKTLSREP